MLKLNVKKLTEAIAGLEAYAPLENNTGVKYLYEMLYIPMANNGRIRLCDIDFDAFTLDDIGEFEDYYDNKVYLHGNMTNHMSSKLRALQPVASKTRFI